MTLNELAGSVSALTLEEFSGITAPFLGALNRAVRRVFTDFSPTASVRLYAGGGKPSSKIERLVFEGEGDYALSLTGRAYSMRLWGKGSFIHTEGGVAVRTDFDSDGRIFNSLIKSGTATLTFTGSDPFTVTNLVTFDGVRGGSVDNIPSGDGEFCLDLKSVTEDFLSFAGPPTSPDGSVIDCATLDGSLLMLPESFEGEITVRYKRFPKRIESDSTGELDIPEELSEPICTLCAALLLTEDAPELSERLLKMYEGDAAAARTAYKQTRKAKVLSDGWA